MQRSSDEPKEPKVRGYTRLSKRSEVSDENVVEALEDYIPPAVEAKFAKLENENREVQERLSELNSSIGDIKALLIGLVNGPKSAKASPVVSEPIREDPRNSPIQPVSNLPRVWANSESKLIEEQANPKRNLDQTLRRESVDLADTFFKTEVKRDSKPMRRDSLYGQVMGTDLVDAKGTPNFGVDLVEVAFKKEIPDFESKLTYLSPSNVFKYLRELKEYVIEYRTTPPLTKNISRSVRERICEKCGITLERLVGLGLGELTTALGVASAVDTREEFESQLLILASEIWTPRKFTSLTTENFMSFFFVFKRYWEEMHKMFEFLCAGQDNSVIPKLDSSSGGILRKIIDLIPCKYGTRLWSQMLKREHYNLVSIQAEFMAVAREDFKLAENAKKLRFKLLDEQKVARGDDSDYGAVAQSLGKRKDATKKYARVSRISNYKEDDYSNEENDNQSDQDQDFDLDSDNEDCRSDGGVNYSEVMSMPMVDERTPTKGYAPQREESPERKPSGDDEEDDYINFISKRDPKHFSQTPNLLKRGSTQAVAVARDRVHPGAASNAKAPRPCYRAVYNGACNQKGCPYDHTRAVILEKMKKALAEMTERVKQSEQQKIAAAKLSVPDLPYDEKRPKKPGGLASDLEIQYVLPFKQEHADINMLRSSMEAFIKDVAVETSIIRAVLVTANIKLKKRTLHPKVLLDSGALNNTYIDKDYFETFRSEVSHSIRKLKDSKVTLAEKNSVVSVKEVFTFPISFVDTDGRCYEYTECFYVVPNLSEEIILGLPSLVAFVLPLFINRLVQASIDLFASPKIQSPEASEALRLAESMKKALSSAMGDTAQTFGKNGFAQTLGKDKTKDSKLFRANQEVPADKLVSDKFSLAVMKAEGVISPQVDVVSVYDYNREQLISSPWYVIEREAPEEEEFPVPCSNTWHLHYLSISHDQAVEDFHKLIDTHVSEEFRNSTDIIRLLKTEGEDVFVPKDWTGVKGVPLIEFNWKENFPEIIKPQPRRVRESLLENAKKELDRLRTYMYEPSTSPWASCLVIAPKATAPFIRFCGDYAPVVNHYIETGHYPIPKVQHALNKISQFRIFLDFDLANSFHQFRLGPLTRKRLSVQTPWGQFEPVFLPEGVPPASGILQKCMDEIFQDCEDWSIVIFDNLLVLAHDYADAYEKAKKIFARCKERNLVLKFSKTWLGFAEVTFFGYVCSYQSYRLSEERLKSIQEIPFPSTLKQMQRFLGCALFFHNFVPNYASLAANLTYMTRKDFNWKDKKSWKLDYEAEFNKFKQALLGAMSISYPDFTKLFILMVDASNDGVGCILSMDPAVTVMDEEGNYIPPPDDYFVNLRAKMKQKLSPLKIIHIASQKFSEQASRSWDAFNKEGYAVVWAVKLLEYFLRGKHFVLMGDHRNLLWMEKSLVPKVIRWRIYLQSLSFDFYHIPGSSNTAADWQSRLYSDETFLPKLLADEPKDAEAESETTIDNVNALYKVSNGLLMVGKSKPLDRSHLSRRSKKKPDVANLPKVWADRQKALEENSEDSQEYPQPESAQESQEEDLPVPVTEEEAEPAEDTNDAPVLISRADMLKQVHGGRAGHLGVKRTYQLLNEKFPGHGISIKQVTEHIQECAVCEKVRFGMENQLVPITRNLRNPGPRRVVGIDYLTLELDKYGNSGAYVMRDHFTKFVGIWPSSKHDAEAAATAIFVYCVLYGEFDYLMSDPGTDFMSDTIKLLNEWFGINHRISLVDRHESNGVEGANKDILRHIRALICDERVKEHWSHPRVILWVMYIMNKRDDAETGVDPYALMFGSEARRYYQFPKSVTIPARASQYLKLLDKDLSALKDASASFQKAVTDKRVSKANPDDLPPNLYQPGDLVLFKHTVDKPRGDKLSPNYLGPYRVSKHVKNEVTCQHLALGTYFTFHSSRVKPYFGNERTGRDLAGQDYDQYQVEEVVAYRGNPRQRTTMEFFVRFADGDALWITWTRDLFNNSHYWEFCHSKPPLWLMAHSTEDAAKLLGNINRTPITEVRPGTKVYLDIRFFGSEWYRQAVLPDNKYFHTYVIIGVYGNFTNRDHTRIRLRIPLTNDDYKRGVDHAFVFEYGSVTVFDAEHMTLVDEAFLKDYPDLI